MAPREPIQDDRDSQRDAPLSAALERFLADPGAAFTTPGHKRAAHLSDALLALDVPLMLGVEDSRMSGRYLARAERLAAELWGADFCRFSVSGSTHGNEALALAVGRPGDRVAVSRNLHKSLFAGLILAGLEPVWLHPDIDSDSGLPAGLPVSEVEWALEQDVRAVMLVEPSYVGVISDVPAIVKCAHAAGVPVIVDQAWGAHLGLHPALPRGALRAGADAIVISAHKTLAAFTQGALVLARKGRLDLDHLDAAFELLNTTSPSAALAASIDRARRIMALKGGDLLERTLELAHHVRGALADVDGLRIPGRHSFAGLPAVADFDPLKLVLLLAGTGADGHAVERDLNDAGVRVELADRDVLIPLLTIGDDDESVRRLIEALRGSLAQRRGAPRAITAPSAWRVHPEMALTPRQAFFAPRERVGAEHAVGRISAETAAPYPPGIPVLAPGEVVTAEVLERLRAEAAAGTRVAYCSDPTLATLLVVRGE